MLYAVFVLFIIVCIIVFLHHAFSTLNNQPLLEEERLFIEAIRDLNRQSNSLLQPNSTNGINEDATLQKSEALVTSTLILKGGNDDTTTAASLSEVSCIVGKEVALDIQENLNASSNQSLKSHEVVDDDFTSYSAGSQLFPNAYTSRRIHQSGGRENGTKIDAVEEVARVANTINIYTAPRIDAIISSWMTRTDCAACASSTSAGGNGADGIPSTASWSTRGSNGTSGWNANSSSMTLSGRNGDKEPHEPQDNALSMENAAHVSHANNDNHLTSHKRKAAASNDLHRNHGTKKKSSIH